MKKILWLWIILGILSLVLIGLIFWQKKSDLYQAKNTIENKPEISAEFRLVALGDSLTQAAAMSEEYSDDNPDFSFSTGTQINSLFQFITNQSMDISPLNLSISGSTSQDILESQVPRVPSDSRQNIYTILVGGNDIMKNVSIAQFESNLKEIIEKIKISDNIILIGTLPNFVAMRSDSISACQAEKLSSETKILAEAGIISYNLIIKKVAAENNLCLVDLYPVLTSAEISGLDCLHFNLNGQKKVASEFVQNYQSLEK